MTGRVRVPALTIAELYDRISQTGEDAMIATLKTFGRTVPAPRPDPFYGLDRRRSPSLRTMERVTARGDFRFSTVPTIERSRSSRAAPAFLESHDPAHV